MKYIAFFIPVLSLATITEAQESNVIATGVSFLRLSPDARGGAMGDAGIATSPDAHSIFWNTAKLAFIQNRLGFSATYAPRFNTFPSGHFLFDASAYWKIDSNNTVTGSIRYDHSAELKFTDASGNPLGSYRPVEYTLHLGYARKLSQHFSAGINIGYVRSNLAAGYLVNGVQLQVAHSLMADVGLFYTRAVRKNSIFRNYNLGLTISNLGGKIRYYSSQITGDFLPANLGLGSNFNFQFGKAHQLSFALDLNKLLVPTPDTAGNYRNESVVEGIFKSFADAPGGAQEEIQEINLSVGTEYWWRKMIALRTGYFYQSNYKGSRQYFGLGAGIKYHVLGLEFSYLIPSSSFKSPHTWRFGLSLDLNSFRNSSSKKL